ncbi:MAG: hypothetical protein ACQES9_08575 [Myxococcota bacterium]
MKRLFIFLPGFLFFSAACSSKPEIHSSWNIKSDCGRGTRVLLLPVDNRVGVKQKIDQKKLEKIWDRTIKSGLSLMKVAPNYLAHHIYKTSHLMHWSGEVVDSEGNTESILNDKELARIYYTLAHFAGKKETKSLNHKISPEIFKKLSSQAEYSFYIANWTTLNQNTNNAFLEFLKVGAIILGVVVISLSVLAIFSKSKGNGVGKLLKTGSKLFVYGAKGIANVTARLFTKSVIRAAGKAALTTTRIAGRVAVHSMRHSVVVMDISPEHISPVYKPDYLRGEETAQNRFLGVENGISPLKPVFTKDGYFLSFILIYNKTGEIMWTARIFVPQGANTKNLHDKVKQVLATIPTSRTL